jgi:hypothetical protein
MLLPQDNDIKLIGANRTTQNVDGIVERDFPCLYLIPYKTNEA